MAGLFDLIGSLINGSNTSNAISKASAAQQQAATAASNQLTTANQNAQSSVASAGDAARTAVLPYATTGTSALSQIANLYGLANGGTITAGGIQGGVNAGQTAQSITPVTQDWNAFINNPQNADILKSYQANSTDPRWAGNPGAFAQWWYNQSPQDRPVPTTGGSNAVTGSTVSTQPVSATQTSVSADPFATFYQSPDYNFKLAQGIAGVNAGAAATGMIDSGATRKAEIAYAGNLASSQYNDYTNKLYQLAGLGQNATNTTAQADTAQGTNSANLATGLGKSLSDITTNQGNNLASSYLGQARNGANTTNAVSSYLGSSGSTSPSNLYSAFTDSFF